MKMMYVRNLLLAWSYCSVVVANHSLYADISHVSDLDDTRHEDAQSPFVLSALYSKFQAEGISDKELFNALSAAIFEGYESEPLFAHSLAIVREYVLLRGDSCKDFLDTVTTSFSASEKPDFGQAMVLTAFLYVTYLENIITDAQLSNYMTIFFTTLLKHYEGASALLVVDLLMQVVDFFDFDLLYKAFDEACRIYLDTSVSTKATELFFKSIKLSATSFALKIMNGTQEKKTRSFFEGIENSIHVNLPFLSAHSRKQYTRPSTCRLSISFVAFRSILENMLSMLLDRDEPDIREAAQIIATLLINRSIDPRIIGEYLSTNMNITIRTLIDVLQEIKSKLRHREETFKAEYLQVVFTVAIMQCCSSSSWSADQILRATTTRSEFFNHLEIFRALTVALYGHAFYDCFNDIIRLRRGLDSDDNDANGDKSGHHHHQQHHDSSSGYHHEEYPVNYYDHHNNDGHGDDHDHHHGSGNHTSGCVLSVLMYKLLCKHLNERLSLRQGR